MGRIGVFGGTFNPPHIGHMAAAAQAKAALNLDRLLLVPDNIAPHKELPQGSADPWQRLEMVRLCALGVPGAECCDLELRREGKSYTVDTLRQVHQMYPSEQLVLLMGSDMFLSLHHWREPEEIFRLASIGVLCRGEKGEKAAIAQQMEKLSLQGADVTLVDNQVTTISSTDLRRLLAFRCAGPFLPAGVGEYIQKNGLYGTDKNLKNLSMEQLEQTVLPLMNPNRVRHVLGCRDTCVEMAKRWGADETHAARAGLLHDITKALDGPLQLTLCREYGMILDDFSREYPKTLHALTGSLVAERIFGEEPQVVQAICRHTTGCADMTTLDKIVYVADYMEPNRAFPGVQELRKYAFEDLDKALLLGLTMTLDMLKQQNRVVSPGSAAAMQWLARRGVTL